MAGRSGTPRLHWTLIAARHTSQAVREQHRASKYVRVTCHRICCARHAYMTMRLVYHDLQVAHVSATMLAVLACASVFCGGALLQGPTSLKSDQVVSATHWAAPLAMAAAAACIAVTPPVALAVPPPELVKVVVGGNAQSWQEGVSSAQAKQKASNERNEKRMARLAQCEDDKRQVKANQDMLPAAVQPATDDPTKPASCVGQPTYRKGDPALPAIYPQQ